MGTVIMLVAFVVEAVFAAYCVITRSNQTKVRSTIRIGVLAAFILFTLVSVIEWSFRWYALAALLLVWAALGAWSLWRRQAEKKDYNAGRIVVRAVSALVLVGIALTPELIFPQHRLPQVTGQLEVATAKFTYTDASRPETFGNSGGNRKVNVEFWYPKAGAAKYPLVVFSHGAFGIKTGNTSTFLELASHGYVVASIDHPYHALYTSGADGRLVTLDPSFFQEVMDVNNGKYDGATAYQIEQKWLKLRTLDINFVLDTIIAQARQSGSEPVYQLIDTGKIGLMGHSLGGAASAQVARERTDVGAVVNLDADLLGEYVGYVGGHEVLNDKAYPVPLLTLLADDMTRLIDAVPDANAVVAVQHVSTTAPRAFEIHIAGTDHQSFTDLPITSPLLVSLITTSVQKAGGGESAPKLAVIEKVNTFTLQFFNAYLKGEGIFSPAGTD